jgi:hypothetical protein
MDDKENSEFKVAVPDAEILDELNSVKNHLANRLDSLSEEEKNRKLLAQVLSVGALFAQMINVIEDSNTKVQYFVAIADIVARLEHEANPVAKA